MHAADRWSRRTTLLLPFALGIAGVARARSGKSSLFVIARSTNANVVHYRVRLDRDGTVSQKEPIGAHWIMHAESGQREELTWLERQFAYGWRVLSPVTRAGFRFCLQACESRAIDVRRDP